MGSKGGLTKANSTTICYYHNFIDAFFSNICKVSVKCSLESVDIGVHFTNLQRWADSCRYIIMTSQRESWRLNLHTNRVFIQQFAHTNNKETSKVFVTLNLSVDFAGDRWFPSTKGQLRGKGFHFITS